MNIKENEASKELEIFNGPALMNLAEAENPDYIEKELHDFFNI